MNITILRVQSNMFYAIVFTIFALALSALALQYRGTAYILLWPAISFLLVALGYGAVGAAVFAKRPDGRRAGWATVVLLPYLAFSWLIWTLRRWTAIDRRPDLIAPGIWLGPRPYRSELPGDVACVVDLTCEFTPAKGIIDTGQYISFPILDKSTPSPQLLLTMVQRVALCAGPIYVHCALGRGRSAMFVAALLIARELATNPQAAEQIIRSKRPSIRLSKSQRNLLEQIQIQLLPHQAVE